MKKITDFFKKYACADIDSDLKTCFKQTNHDSLQANRDGIWTKIDFDEQKKLYEQISSTTFDEIWMYCESTYYPSEIKAQKICAVVTGKYQKYLTDLGKNNPRIAKYPDRIQASGDFNGSDIQYHEILKENSDFNLNDSNVQSKRNAHLIQRKEPKFE